MVIIENPELLNAFKLYEDNKNIDTLKKSIFALLRFSKIDPLDTKNTKNGFFIIIKKTEKKAFF